MTDKAVKTDLATITVPIDSLKPHPRNYQGHPDDEISHLMASISENGIYRPVVVARGNVILAGHGVVKASKKLGLKSLPVVQIDLEPNDPRALKILIGDNEIRHLAERDDRMLSEMLKEINETDISSLLGTGYDDMMLANLIFVTRPASEIKDFDEAAQWVGMLEYAPEDEIKLIVKFRNEADRLAFCQKISVSISESKASIWWPDLGTEDVSSIRVAG